MTDKTAAPRTARIKTARIETAATDRDVLYTGIPVAVFAAVLVGAALLAFGRELADINAFLAIGINLIVVGGAAPTVLRWRRAPVWRWPVYGTCVGGVVSFVVLGISVVTNA
ncbi:DUF2537 domain-containing protein [Rhodococcus sp. G-MC3]|uniref:DUF2537 domain-containing protein n=1 Tax=Rhodococcus sp. G-MC3 TaxID=3046209 RepID=UPI0024B96726|nr:DUF2537 domain-containing protein [Rhodococcus sp. G-MC3]MDJ0393827.1 DUF2537 domain-containing protein [Rhodococcus sp. G-MC3]